jgi:hypothetical protein
MNAKKNLGASLLVCAVLASPAAFAASVTYDFTGTTTSASGDYASIADGTTITGTYTINVANGVPSQSVLPVSLTSAWSIHEYSGTAYSIPSNSAYVFSSTANVGAFSYQTSAIPGAYASGSIVLGANAGSVYIGQETQFTTSTLTSYGISDVDLTNTSGNPYTIDGLPVFSGATAGSGYFTTGGGSINGEVMYNITSLTAVPLPAAAWLLLSGLVGVGVMARKRRGIAA